MQNIGVNTDKGKRKKMAETTKISWTSTILPDGSWVSGATFNPWLGCSRVSPGCENCYAENLMDHRYKRVEWGPGKPRVRTKTWKDPVKWNKEAGATGVRKKVFCASLADWLDEEIDLSWREDLFDLIEQCTNLDWLMLTKRPQNAEKFLRFSWLDNPLPHVWFGVTAENQKWWDVRVRQLADVPAETKWVSYEPSLGPLMIDTISARSCDWLIIGGESEQTSEAREFKIEWAESVIEQCRAWDIVPFMKQVGGNATYQGKPFKTKDKAGTDPDEWPYLIRVREFPKSKVPA